MQTDPTGMDLDWYAIDSRGRVGYFTTGGSDCIPGACLSGWFPDKEIRKYFLGLEISCGYTSVNKRGGDEGDWKKMASVGIYSFDWNMKNNGPYELIYKPEKEITASKISEEMRKFLPILDKYDFTSPYLLLVL